MKFLERLKEATLNKIDPTRAAKIAKQSKGYQTRYDVLERIGDYLDESNPLLLIDLDPKILAQ